MRKHFLVLFDAVPGGTGYLREYRSRRAVFDLLEDALSTALNSVVASKTDDPLRFLSAQLLRIADAKEPLATGQSPATEELTLPPETDEGGTDKWMLSSWIKGVGLERVYTAALQPPTREGADKEEVALAFLRVLSGHRDSEGGGPGPRARRGLAGCVGEQIRCSISGRGRPLKTPCRSTN